MSYDTQSFSTRRRVNSLAVDRIDEQDFQLVKLMVGDEGVANAVSTTNPIPVAVVSGGGGGGGGSTDITSVIPGVGATNLGKAEDAPHNSGDTGVMLLGVRNDADVALAATSGDYVPAQFDANGYLKVNIKAGAGSGGTASTDDAAFAIAVGSGTPIMGVATSDTVDSGDVGVVGMTTARAMFVAVQNSSIAVTDNSGSLTVDGALTSVGTVTAVTAITNALPAGNNNIGDVDIVTLPALPTGSNTIGNVGVTSQIPGTGATNLGKAEDAAHASGDTGVAVLAVRRDSAANSTSTDGDYSTLSVDASGNLRVTGGGGGQQYAEDAAHVSADLGTMALTVRADTAAATSGTTGDYQPLITDANGRLHVNLGAGGIAGVVEDAASAGGEEGVLVMTVRQDTQASTTSTDGDFANLKTNSIGSVYASLAHLGANAILTGNGVTGTGSARVTIASDNTAFSVNAQGTAAQDAAIAGNPVPTGMRASTATPSAMSADGDIVYPWATRTGATVISGDNVDDAAFTPGTSRVVVIAAQADETATDPVDEGDAGALRITLDRKLITTPYAHPAGGYTPVSTVSAASTNATSLKASAGTVGAVTVTNINAAMRYLKFYNKASAPTVGTDTPVYVVPLPGATAGAGAHVGFGDSGLNFSTGIAWALTTGPTVADTGAVAASEIIVSIAYI